MLQSAELAWYVTGRFYLDARDRWADYGYFLHLAGIDADLFAGAPGEGAAHFTFAAVPFAARRVANGSLSLSLDPVGEFSLYLQRTPAGTFDDPRSFAEGERIATFRRTSLVAGTTLENAAAKPLIASNVFSARLVDSVPFTFAERRHDLAELLSGGGVTQFGTASEVPIAPPAGYSAAAAFAGSAIALGTAAR